MTEQYKEYIKSPEWAEKKRQRALIDNNMCVMCKRPIHKIRVLQCHHVNYYRLGHENVYSDLVTLCGTCHKKLHNYLSRVKSPDR